MSTSASTVFKPCKRCPGSTASILGKNETFVLDFVNDADGIQQAFQPYYEHSTVTEQADPRQLYDLRTAIYALHIVFEIEVEQFTAVFFKHPRKQTQTNHALLNSIMDKAVTRYEEAEDQPKLDLRARMQAFTRLYTFLSQVIPYDDSGLEKLDAYLRFLDEKLGNPNPHDPINLDKDVRLKYYRLQKISEGRIVLEAGTGGSLSAPSEVGTGRNEDEQVRLSLVVQVLNDRFGTNFTPTDELFWEQVRDDAIANQNLQQAGAANTVTTSPTPCFSNWRNWWSTAWIATAARLACSSKNPRSAASSKTGCSTKSMTASAHLRRPRP
jgi:type I restriction enzyme R subunit